MNEFEKWAKETYGGNVIDATPRYQSLPYLTDLKMAYKAGAAAMREKCEEAAKELDIVPGSCNEYGELTKRYDSWLNGVFDTQEQIAVAIRKLEVKHGER